MLKLSRLRIYILIYLIVMILIALIGFWTPLDYAIYKALYIDDTEKIDLLEKITIIDIPYYQNEEDAKEELLDLPNLRGRLTDLLNEIKLQADEGSKPEVVILDFYFPYELKTDRDNLEILKEAVLDLKEKEIKVFGVYNVDYFYDDDNKDKNFKDFDKKQAKELYNIFEDGRLHAVIENVNGILYYKSVYELPQEKGNDGVIRGTEHIEALPVKVAHAIEPKPRTRVRGEVFMLLIGDSTDLRKQTYRFTHPAELTTGGEFSKEIKMDGKYLIIGSREGDKIEEGIDDITSQYGTQLLAWALNDQISPNEEMVKYPLNNSVVQLGMPLFFAILVVVIFGFLFKFVRKFSARPVIFAISSFLICTAVLLLLGGIIWYTGYFMPLALTILSMLTASVLSYLFCNKFLVLKVAEGSRKYDVFISYSFDHQDWIRENIYQHLIDKGLEVYFAEKKIKIGQVITGSYMRGIVNSKCFVPFFTEDYYGKNHCMNEMDLAYYRMLENPKFIKIYPIAEKFEYVPEIYKHRLTNIIEGNEEFIQDLLNSLDEES